MRITGMSDLSIADVARVDLDRVDLFDSELYVSGDPHLVWAAMRARAPLHRQVLPDGRAFWSVTRYQDACRVLGNHREFTSEQGSLLSQLGHGDAAAGKMLVATDPPRHTELRMPLRRLFSGHAISMSEKRIRQAVRSALRPARETEVWDVAQQVAMLPMAVAGALMGIPEQDWSDLVRWTAMATAPEDSEYLVASSGATLAIAHHELFEYFSREVRVRVGTEGDDVIRHLMRMPVGDSTLTRDEVVVNCYSVLLGANATTPHTIAGTVLALMENGDQFRVAYKDPAIVPTLVEEGLRWTSAASSFLRHAVDTIELGGGQVEPGDAVAVWVGSANRDESVFADPYCFDANRADNRHIAFGFGPHYCLGASVARLTLRIFFEEFIQLIKEIEPAGPPRHLKSNFVAGLTHLPVRTLIRTDATKPRDWPGR
ncbi:cytochrome P450 [Streptomyces sp. NBC_01262]|uniref:cytochrome P450 n=1 Tax=Streptomyces sp. NBC_01262 TaxID=2903803 RepID=UPI002E308984|nr:cytochrome P450 [Streptomyces sp. NBC_01262]